MTTSRDRAVFAAHLLTAVRDAELPFPESVSFSGSNMVVLILDDVQDEMAWRVHLNAPTNGGVVWHGMHVGLHGHPKSYALDESAQAAINAALAPQNVAVDGELCALAHRKAVTCDGGALKWRVRYYVGEGVDRADRGVSGPSCYSHATHEEQWTQAHGAIRYGEAEPIPADETADDRAALAGAILLPDTAGVAS